MLEKEILVQNPNIKWIDIAGQFLQISIGRLTGYNDYLRNIFFITKALTSLYQINSVITCKQPLYKEIATGKNHKFVNNVNKV